MPQCSRYIHCTAVKAQGPAHSCRKVQYLKVLQWQFKVLGQLIKIWVRVLQHVEMQLSARQFFWTNCHYLINVQCIQQLLDIQNCSMIHILLGHRTLHTKIKFWVRASVQAWEAVLSLINIHNMSKRQLGPKCRTVLPLYQCVTLFLW